MSDSPRNNTSKVLFVENPAAYLRDEAVRTRRLARIYDDEARVTGSDALAKAAALVYRRAEDMEADAKRWAA